MSRPLKELTGRRVGSDGRIEQVRAVLYAPEPDPQHGAPSCRVHCPALFDRDPRIAGVDDDQAVALASGFVRQMFAHRGVALTGERDL